MGKATKITLIILGVILLIPALFYTIIPHSVHLSTGLDFGFSHTVHVLGYGIPLLIIAIILIVTGSMIKKRK